MLKHESEGFRRDLGSRFQAPYATSLRSLLPENYRQALQRRFVLTVIPLQRAGYEAHEGSRHLNSTAQNQIGTDVN